MRKVLILMIVLLVFSGLALGQPSVNTIGSESAKNLGNYDCENLRIGILGTSNTQKGSARDDLDDLIEATCPGTEVFLEANPGKYPGHSLQISSLQKILAEGNLNYIILNPSENGIPKFYDPDKGLDEYTPMVIKWVDMVKESNSNTKVVVLTNTPALGYSGVEITRRKKQFNDNLIENRLGSSKIDYVVDTYSKLGDPEGSDNCGKYCSSYVLNDKIHLGSNGMHIVVKAILDEVFGKKEKVEQPIIQQTTTTDVSTDENCLSGNRCREIDEVWSKLLTKIVSKARAGQIWHTLKGWVTFNKRYLETVEVGQTGSSTESTTVSQDLPRIGKAASESEVDNLKDASPELVKQFIRVNLGEQYIEDVEYLTRVLTIERGCSDKWKAERGGIAQVVINRVHSAFWPNTVKDVVSADFLPNKKKGSGWYGAADPKAFPIQDSSRGIDGKPTYKSCVISAIKFMMGTGIEDVGAKKIGGRVGFSHWCTLRASDPPKEPAAFHRNNAIMAQPEAWSATCESPSSLNQCGGCGAHFSGQDPTPKRSSIRLYRGGSATTLNPTSAVVSGNIKYSNTDNYQLVSGGGWLCPKDEPRPNQGLQEQQYNPNCPAGMVKVENEDFCIDKYEASLVLKSNPSESWSPFCEVRKHNVEVRAVSLEGAIPHSNINGIEAEKACLNAGKRLCKEEEWLRACQGPDGWDYPYGPVVEAGKCNDQETPKPYEHIVLNLIKNYPEKLPGAPLPPPNGYNNHPYMQHPYINQQPNSVTKTGANSECVTSDGVYDMVGNVYEWTSERQVNGYSGGYYQLTRGTRKGCLFRAVHGESYSDYSVGLRCCADVGTVNLPEDTVTLSAPSEVNDEFCNQIKQQPKEEFKRSNYLVTPGALSDFTKFRTEHYGYFTGFASKSLNSNVPNDYAEDTTFMGVPVKLNRKIIPALKCVEMELTTKNRCQTCEFDPKYSKECETEWKKYPYQPVRTSGIRYVNSAGYDKGGEASNHVYGIAIDLDPGYDSRYSNGCCSCFGEYQNDPLCKDGSLDSYQRMIMPTCWVEVFKEYGFYWLGDETLRDNMHYEFLGNPDIIAAAQG